MTAPLSPSALDGVSVSPPLRNTSAPRRAAWIEPANPIPDDADAQPMPTWADLRTAAATVSDQPLPEAFQ